MVTAAIVPTMELPCADFRQRCNSRDVRFFPRKLSRPENRVLRRDVMLSSILINMRLAISTVSEKEFFDHSAAWRTPSASRKLAPQQALSILSASENLRD